MRSGRHPDQTEADDRARLTGRVAELEHRIRLLEARLRQLGESPEAQAKGPAAKPKVAARKARAPRPKPRCPGCLLELPRGRRKAQTCVWCGFRLDAVRPLVLGRASK